MPKRKDIKSIMLIGSGPIIIGQACEFDYSGTCEKTLKALKEEGFRVILVNSNPATIMRTTRVLRYIHRALENRRPRQHNRKRTS